MKQNKLKKEFLNEEAESQKDSAFLLVRKKGSTVRASGESPPPCSSQLTRDVVVSSARYGVKARSVDLRENQ